MLLRRSQFSGLLMGLFLLAAGAPVDAQPEQRLRVAENLHFEIVALDARSAGFVDVLSRHVVQTALRYVDPLGLQSPRRVLVRLKPESYADFEGPYEVRVSQDGFVTLDLRWEAGLELDQTCRALSKALLLRYAFYNYGPAGLEALPEWTISALGDSVFRRLRPALRRYLVAQIDPAGMPDLATLLSRPWQEAAQRSHGYWLLEALEMSGLSASEIRNIYRQGLAGLDVMPPLREILLGRLPPSAEEAFSLEDWWAEQIPLMTAPQNAVFESLEASRRWISELGEFTIDDEPANFKTLWTRRTDADIRTLVEARLEILRLRITRVNPAYFNAARSLGILFETILDGKANFQFIDSLSKFLGDFEDTRALEAVVAEKLGAT